MILMCGAMKIKYLIFPEAKKRDFELMAKQKNVEITEVKTRVVKEIKSQKRYNQEALSF